MQLHFFSAERIFDHKSDFSPFFALSLPQSLNFSHILCIFVIVMFFVSVFFLPTNDDIAVRLSPLLFHSHSLMTIAKTRQKICIYSRQKEKRYIFYWEERWNKIRWGENRKIHHIEKKEEYLYLIPNIIYPTENGFFHPVFFSVNSIPPFF